MAPPPARHSGDTTPEVASTPDDGAPRADLLLIAGEGVYSSYPLAHDPLVIGRGGGVDVRIDHPELSRRHAILRPGRPGQPTTIQDLGSRNGTRVAGASHRGGDPVALRSSDSFHIGPFSFVLVRSGAAELRSFSVRNGVHIADPTPAGVPALVRDVATSTTSVIILGETGVGKEVLAETVHALSGRPGPFMRINCAALSESLLESELFGHEKGAFTGATAQKRGLLESAARGTVFLDEVGELPPSVQAKLLRAIEHREVLRLGSTRPVGIDARFVAATNRDLPAEVEVGAFRRDLFFRLDGMTLVIPPLRTRKHMIGRLALDFLGPGARLGADVLAALEGYAWPGNVRELRAVIERAVLLARGEDVAVGHLRFADTPLSSPVAAATAAAAAPATDLAEVGLSAEDRAERARIVAALKTCAGNQTRAARELGIPRTTLATRMAMFRIPRPRS